MSANSSYRPAARIVVRSVFGLSLTLVSLPLIVAAVLWLFDAMGLLIAKSIHVHPRQWLALLAYALVLAVVIDLPILMLLRSRRLLSPSRAFFVGAAVAAIPLALLMAGGEAPFRRDALTVLLAAGVVGGVFNLQFWHLALRGEARY